VTSKKVRFTKSKRRSPGRALIYVEYGRETLCRIQQNGDGFYWHGARPGDTRGVSTKHRTGVARDLEGCKREVTAYILQGVVPGEASAESMSPGGIVLPKMPEPEPTPEPQEDKPKRWRFTVGFYPFESTDQHAKKALEVLYAIGLGQRGFKQESWEKRERVRELLDQLAQEMVGEVPSIEELC
jgi:hypothetical protein